MKIPPTAKGGEVLIWQLRPFLQQASARIFKDAVDGFLLLGYFLRGFLVTGFFVHY
jgi:hypothetical protein